MYMELVPFSLLKKCQLVIALTAETVRLVKHCVWYGQESVTDFDYLH